MNDMSCSYRTMTLKYMNKFSGQGKHELLPKRDPPHEGLDHHVLVSCCFACFAFYASRCSRK